MANQQEDQQKRQQTQSGTMGGQKSLGQYRVGTDFNSGKNPHVDEIKTTVARVIDKVEQLKDQAHGDPEILRCFEQSLLLLEDAAMWAVKGVTKTQQS